MIGPDHDVHRLQPDQPVRVRGVARPLDPVHAPESDIGRRAVQPVEHAGKVASGSGLDRDHPRQVLDHRRQRPHRREQVTPEVDPQRPVDVPGRSHRAVPVRQRLPRRLQKTAPGLGQLDRVPAAREQLHAELGLQPRDALGQRLLAHRELLGGLPEMQPLGGGDERPHLRQIKIHALHHGLPPMVVETRGRLLDPVSTPVVFLIPKPPPAPETAARPARGSP
jgi:hypothetical protein